MLTNGLHAFGQEEAECIKRLKKKKPMVLTIADFGSPEAAAAFQLIEEMLRFEAKRRPTVSNVLTRFYFTADHHKIKNFNPKAEPQESSTFLFAIL